MTDKSVFFVPDPKTDNDNPRAFCDIDSMEDELKSLGPVRMFDASQLKCDKAIVDAGIKFFADEDNFIDDEDENID